MLNYGNITYIMKENSIFMDIWVHLKVNTNTKVMLTKITIVHTWFEWMSEEAMFVWDPRRMGAPLSCNQHFFWGRKSLPVALESSSAFAPSRGFGCLVMHGDKNNLASEVYGL